MYGITTLTTKGQVTVPEEARKLLNAQVGDKFIFDQLDIKNKRGSFKIVSTKNVVDELYGALKPYNKLGYVPLDIARQKAGELLGKKYGLKKLKKK